LYSIVNEIILTSTFESAIVLGTNVGYILHQVVPGTSVGYVLLWLSNCTSIISSIYVLYFLNIYAF
jgi:putative effector of murein hydrolase LrgA (UPF0299 family)